MIMHIRGQQRGRTPNRPASTTEGGRSETREDQGATAAPDEQQDQQLQAIQRAKSRSSPWGARFWAPSFALAKQHHAVLRAVQAPHQQHRQELQAPSSAKQQEHNQGGGYQHDR